MTLRAIKKAILDLPKNDQFRLENWLSDRWDYEMEQDFSPGGRGAKLLEKVKAAVRAGKSMPMEKGRAHYRSNAGK